MKIGKYRISFDLEEFKAIMTLFFVIIGIVAYALGGTLLIGHVFDVSFDQAMGILFVVSVLIMGASFFISIEKVKDE